MARFRIAGMALALACSVVAFSPAAADDMHRGSIKDAPFTWTGFYVGVNGGHLEGDSSHSSVMSCPSGGCPFGLAGSLNSISASGVGSLDADSLTGGIQAGYNVQHGRIVYGAELDFNALDLNQSRSVSDVTPGLTAFTTTTAMSADWLFTARARLGLTPASNSLAYVTGGLAVADLNISNAFSAPDVGGLPASGASSTREFRTGWTVGGGLEVALSRNWTLKAEYLFVDLGSVRTSARVNNVPNVGNDDNILATTGDLTMQIGRAGINYKF